MIYLQVPLVYFSLDSASVRKTVDFSKLSPRSVSDNGTNIYRKPPIYKQGELQTVSFLLFTSVFVTQLILAIAQNLTNTWKAAE